MLDAPTDTRRQTDFMTTSTTPPGQRALRRGRRTLSNVVYLITFCTHDRRRWFARPTLARLAGGVCNDDATWPSARPLLWLLMPDHWHGIVEVTGSEPLGQTVARIKGLCSRVAAPLIDGPLWQRGFHDHALRRHEDLESVMAYVLHNPVRQGLVERWDEWPWRGGAWSSKRAP
jgi:REP element-mobilizing transposase RayT